MDYSTLTPLELEARLTSGERTALVDVREPEEHAIARIEGAQLMPLSRFNEWAATLDPEQEIVVMCHHGIRSAQVCAYLAGQGFKKVHNLAGGIDRWSAEVDSEVPRY